MASPAFRAAGTTSFSSNNVANPTTLTPGAPAGKAVGDDLVLVCASISNTATVATPAGWTLHPSFPKRSGTASGGTFYVFLRTADGTASDTPSPVWSGLTTGTSGSSCSAVILAFTGASNVPDGVSTVADDATDTTTTTIPATTTSQSGSLVVGMAIKIGDLSSTSTVATFTEAVDSKTTSGTGHTLEVSYLTTLGVPGSSGTAAVTWSVTTSARALAVSFALQGVQTSEPFSRPHMPPGVPKLNPASPYMRLQRALQEVGGPVPVVNVSLAGTSSLTATPTVRRGVTASISGTSSLAPGLIHTWTNNAEGGQPGGLVTTGDTGSGDPWTVIPALAGDSVLQYTASPVWHGSLAYKMATRTGNANDLTWDSNYGLASHYIRFYFMADVVPTSDTIWLNVFSHNAAAGAGQLLQTASNGLLRLRNSSGGAAAYTFSTVPVPRQWYRAEAFVSVNGTTTATWQVQLYVGDSTSLLEDTGQVAVVNTGSPANADRVVFGHTGAGANVPSATGFQYYDDLLAYALTWPGPTTPPQAADSSRIPGLQPGVPRLLPVPISLRLQRATAGPVPTVYRPVNVSIAGSSVLSATFRELHQITASLAGTSSLSATFRELQRITITLAGASSLTGTVTALHQLIATVAGASSLTATVSKVQASYVTTADPAAPKPRFSGPPKLGNVALRLRLAQEQRAAGSRPFGSLGVTIQGTSSLAANVTEYHRITASIAGKGTFAATLTPLRRFTASLAGSSSLSATLRELHRLSATLSGTSSLAATVRELHRISVTVAGKGSLAANLVELHRLSASLTGRGTVSASLTLYHRLQGSIAGSSSLSAAVSALHRLSAALAGRSSVSATVTSEHRLTLTVAGRSSFAAGVSELRRFSAGVAGDSSVTAQIVLHPRVGIAGMSSLTAAVGIISGIRNPLPFDRPSDDARTGVIHRDDGVRTQELGGGTGLTHRDTDFDRPAGRPSS